MSFNMSKRIILVLVTFYLFVGNVLSSTATVQCGVPKISEVKVIRHGHETVPGEWPWHAAVYHRKMFSDIYACGGTLISEHFILTAAHCMMSPENGYKLSKKNIFIRLGTHNLHYINCYTLQQHSVQHIHIHANYSYNSVQNDIAILELDTIAQFNNYVQPACLGLNQDLTGRYGTVIGWGRTENEEISPVLREARMPVIDVYTCLESDRALFGETLSRGILCGGYTNGTAVCNGDSGSGFFFEYKKAWYLGGIVSYTKLRSYENRLCNTNGFGGFTNVQTYLPWILSITELHVNSEEGDQCVLRNNRIGICRKATECRSAGTENVILCNGESVICCDVIRQQCEYIKLIKSSPFTNNIVGGTRDADVGEFPFMALVEYDEEEHRCGASIISKRFLLSAANCFMKRVNMLRVRLGTVDATDKHATSIEITRFHRHPNFNKKQRDFDIGVIELKEDIKMSKNIKPICLYTELEDLPENTDLALLGWGINNEAEFPNILVKRTIQPVLRSECQRRYSRLLQISENQMCALGSLNEQGVAADACWGDGGGPLVLEKDGHYHLVGIVSYGPGCGSDLYAGIYTRVSRYLDWIVKVVLWNNTLG